VEKRIRIFRILIILLIAILGIRIFQIQILEGEKYKNLSENNRIKLIREYAPRGIIFDRNGIQLVKNEYKYNIYFPEDTLSSNKKVREKLAKLFSLNFKEILENSKNREWGKLILVKYGANISELTKVLEDFDLQNSALIIKVPVRKYLVGDAFSHIIGYTGEMTKEKFKILKEKGYNIKDIIGMDGIEYVFDEILRGEDGGGQIEVNAEGKKIRTLGYKKPKSGADIYLTIDKRIQEIVDEAMKGKTGAVVVMNPKNGEILSLLSKPSYPLEIFNNKLSSEEWKKLQNHSAHPFQNRAISAKHPPGSIFKIITAVAALENGITNEKEIFLCKGNYKVGKRIFKCWERKGHGKIDLVRGIAHSCDVVFYTLGERLGVEKLKEFSLKFGLGQNTNIELPGELKGTVPDRKWKRINFRGGRWFLGDTINMSIGQGFLQVTPLQMAVVTSIIANGGYKVKPLLIKKIVNREEEIYPSVKKVHLGLKKETLQILKKGMRLAVKEGTGKLCEIPFVEISGKTGTADDPPKSKPHAWFVGFAPSENPLYCVVVMIEEGGKGGEVAAPIAKEIFEKIFEIKGKKI
jgi:penicillin-binding protein 2